MQKYIKYPKLEYLSFFLYFSFGYLLRYSIDEANFYLGIVPLFMFTKVKDYTNPRDSIVTLKT